MIDEQTGTSVRRSKRTTRFGSPVKHSVKEISTDEDIADLNETALEQYRYKLANLKSDPRKPLETRLNLLERHLFRRKFGYSALDKSRPWKTQWKVPLDLTRETNQKLSSKNFRHLPDHKLRQKLLIGY